MTPDKWEKIKDLFLEAEKMSPENRKEFLEKECGDDLKLRQEVEKLLNSNKDDLFLEDTAIAEAPSLFDEKTKLKQTEETQSQIHTTTSDSAKLVEGSVLAKRYRILGLLGKGGMGEVYKAQDIKLDQTVALKFLPEKLKQNEDALKRFVGEVKTARQVAHENVCKVFDIGEVDGKSYLSMEFIEGDDLSKLLNRIGRLPSDKAIEISRQICMGLNAIHKTGILHRDLKPANIIIDANGKARITDFGIAGFEADVQGRESRVGTPAYMSPEQITGKEVTQKSDIYSLGLLIYEIFTGKQAFEGESLSQLTDIHGTTDPTDPSELVEHLDPTVETVIKLCLEKSPSERPNSALHVAMALPGGSPLQVALEAGETPTPEMVAAAPKKGVLKLPVALSLLAAFIGLFTLVMYFASEYQISSWTPLEKSPEVLKERAKTILNNLGYTDVPSDTDYGFRDNNYYVDYRVKLQDFSLYSNEKLRSGQPFLLYFWYRQSPKRIKPNFPGRTTETDPPLTEPGTEYVKLDARGRLVEMIAVPPQISPQKTNSETNWESLFKEAGLDIEKFREIEPKLTPPIHSDKQIGWQGTYADFENIPIRIEAAAFNGKPVYFRVVPLWEDDVIKKGDYRESTFHTRKIINFVFNFLTIFGAIILSYFNLTAGRGDLKGAVKISIFYFFARVISRLISYDFDSILNDWLEIFFRIGGEVIVLFLVYVAIEPFVRRWWSEILISWNRLLAGDFKNPMIGRDILIGGILGIILSLTDYFGGFLRDYIASQERTIVIFRNLTLDGTRENIANILDLVPISIILGLLYLILLVIFYLVFRRKWLATLFIGLFLVSFPAIRLFHGRGWTFVLVLTLVYIPIVYLFARFGLVSIISGIIFISLLSTAITFDTSRFYFSNTIIVAVIGLAIALYGFYISIGDQRIFEGKILKDIKN